MATEGRVTLQDAEKELIETQREYDDLLQEVPVDWRTQDFPENCPMLIKSVRNQLEKARLELLALRRRVERARTMQNRDQLNHVLNCHAGC